jgi:hypothetical protein
MMRYWVRKEETAPLKRYALVGRFSTMKRDENIERCKYIISETRRLVAEMEDRQQRSRELLSQSFDLMHKLRSLRLPARHNGGKRFDKPDE